MTNVLERIPATVQAGLLDRVLASKHPKLALGSIAANAHMTLADLQALLKQHGYPDPARMRAARDDLAAAATDHPSDDEHAGGEVPLAERLQQIKVTDLKGDPDNPRDKILDTDVEELAESITEVGLLQPIVARRSPRGLVVVAGHRRLAAVRLLRWTHVPVIVRAEMRPDHVLAAMLIENGQRRDLDPIEEARGLARLKAETPGCNDQHLARRVGRHQTYVSDRLALLLLTSEDQDRVRSGDLGITEGTRLGRLNGGKVRKSNNPHRDRIHHFGATHDLATRAGARCKRLRHKGIVAGGQACGECWESVIRADERDTAQRRLATTGDCPTCG